VPVTIQGGDTELVRFSPSIKGYNGPKFDDPSFSEPEIRIPPLTPE